MRIVQNHGFVVGKQFLSRPPRRRDRIELGIAHHGHLIVAQIPQLTEALALFLAGE